MSWTLASLFSFLARYALRLELEVIPGVPLLVSSLSGGGKTSEFTVDDLKDYFQFLIIQCAYR